MSMEEEGETLKRLIIEDNVEELSNILNSNELLRKNFNTFLSCPLKLIAEWPLLLLAVNEKSQKVVEYLLSQDFVDKTICNSTGENIYHVICGIRGAEELFSIIERKVPHHLLLDISKNEMNAFDIACEENNVFIVKRVHEILQTLQFDLIEILNKAMKYTVLNNVKDNIDIDVIKYVSSIDGVQLNEDTLFTGISLKFDIVVHLLNVYLCQSIPSHLHNQFHIFQFSNLNTNHNYNNHNINNKNNNEDQSNNDYYLKFEENFKKLVNMKKYWNRIWHEVCYNNNLDVVQLILTLKGIQAEILNDKEYNVFLRACGNNSNIKVIKYIHKLFPSFIHSQLYVNLKGLNGAFFILNNSHLNSSDKLKIFHYLYLNGIDIHFLLRFEQKMMSIYSLFKKENENMIQYLKVISQDFDYQNNEHDDDAYKKPSFWKEFHSNNNNNNNNNNNMENEQSKRINEWKNRFDEHALRHLSKMIQEHMLVISH